MSEKDHIRVQPGPGSIGVGAVTVPKTPGDYRTGGSLRSQIEPLLGLKRLAT